MSHNRLTRDLRRIVYVLLALISLWYVADCIVASPVIPAPHKGILRFFQLFPTLSKHLAASLLRIFVALGCTLLVGYPVGIFLGRNLLADKLVTPVIYGLYPIPKVAFFPVLMVLFGISNVARIILIILILVCQVVISVRDSVRHIPYAYVRSIRMLGGSSRDLFTHVILPASLPNLLTSIKIGVGTGLSVLFFAETFGTTWGIGFFIMDSWVRIAYVDMFAGIIGVSTLGMTLFFIITLLERKFCSWVR